MPGVKPLNCNDSKFAHMHFWSGQPTEAVTYYINGKIISSVNRTKDLGILLSSMQS